MHNFWAPIALWYGVFSALCVLVYGADKLAARRGAARVPERVLLGLGFIGGWPGAWLAQRLWRHKTAKWAFQWRFWLSVVLNLALLWLGWRWQAG